MCFRSSALAPFHVNFVVHHLFVLKTYICCIYYIVHKLNNLSRVVNHLDMHAHLDVEGKCKEAMEAIKNMVAKEVSYMPNVTSSTIGLAINNTFLFHHLFNEHGEGPMELLKGKKLDQTMSKFASMCSP